MKKQLNYVSRSKWKLFQPLFFKVIEHIQRKGKEDENYKITFNPHIIGSRRTNLITQFPNSPFDFDLNLWIAKTDIKDEQKIFNLIWSAIPKKIDEYNIEIEAKTRVIKISFIKQKNIVFSIDLAIARFYKNKLSILVNDSDNLVWNVYSSSLDNLKGKINDIKNKKKWQLVREEYLELKNQENLNQDPSYILYIQSINNIYNRLNHK
jgi:hypothetical protein